MTLRHASVSLIALALVACGGDKPEAKVPETTSTPASTEPAPPPAPTTDTSESSAGTGSGAGGSASTPAPEPALTDENICAITAAVNKGEVEQGKIATGKAKNAKVKKFAQMMVTDHGDVDKKHTELLKKEKLTPADNAMSTQLQSDSSATVTSLGSLTGADFDKAYMEAQVKLHQTALDALDQKLLPAVKNASLKTQLTAVRAKIEAHLKQAQTIVGELGAGGAGAGAGAGTGTSTSTGTGTAKPDTAPKK